MEKIRHHPKYVQVMVNALLQIDVRVQLVILTKNADYTSVLDMKTITRKLFVQVMVLVYHLIIALVIEVLLVIIAASE
jgi:translation elongation factor EF-1alpha